MCCTPECIYFDSNPHVDSEWEEGNVKYRKIQRICGFSGKPIKNWHRCFRKNGPKIKGD